MSILEEFNEVSDATVEAFQLASLISSELENLSLQSLQRVINKEEPVDKLDRWSLEATIHSANQITEGLPRLLDLVSFVFRNSHVLDPARFVSHEASVHDEAYTFVIRVLCHAVYGSGIHSARSTTSLLVDDAAIAAAKQGLQAVSIEWLGCFKHSEERSGNDTPRSNLVSRLRVEAVKARVAIAGASGMGITQDPSRQMQHKAAPRIEHDATAESGDGPKKPRRSKRLLSRNQSWKAAYLAGKSHKEIASKYHNDTGINLTEDAIRKAIDSLED